MWRANDTTVDAYFDEKGKTEFVIEDDVNSVPPVTLDSEDDMFQVDIDVLFIDESGEVLEDIKYAIPWVNDPIELDTPQSIESVVRDESDTFSGLCESSIDRVNSVELDVVGVWKEEDDGSRSRIDTKEIDL